MKTWVERKLTATLRVHAASVLPAKIDINDNALVLEVRANIAICVGEICSGRAPGAWVRVPGGDVGRDSIPPELPNTNTLVTPLHRHNPTLRIIVRTTVRIGGASNSAAGVVIGSVVAVARETRAAHDTLYVHLALVRCVKRHLVTVCGLVHRLHDVDLTMIGPIGGIDKP